MSTCWIWLLFALFSKTHSKACVPAAAGHHFYLGRGQLFVLGPNVYIEYSWNLTFSKFHHWDVLDFLKGISKISPCTRNTTIARAICQASQQVKSNVAGSCLVSGEGNCHRVRHSKTCDWQMVSLIPLKYPERAIIACGMFRKKVFCRNFRWSALLQRWLTRRSLDDVVPLSFITQTKDVQAEVHEYDPLRGRYYILIHSNGNDTVSGRNITMRSERTSLIILDSKNPPTYRTDKKRVERQNSLEFPTGIRQLQQLMSFNAKILARRTQFIKDRIYFWQTKLDDDGKAAMPQLARLCRNAPGKIVEDAAYRILFTKLPAIDLKCAARNATEGAHLIDVHKLKDDIYTIEKTIDTNEFYLCHYSFKAAMKVFQNGFFDNIFGHCGGSCSDCRKQDPRHFDIETVYWIAKEILVMRDHQNITKPALDGTVLLQPNQMQLSLQYDELTTLLVAQNESDIHGNKYDIVYITTNDFKLIKYSIPHTTAKTREDLYKEESQKLEKDKVFSSYDINCDQMRSGDRIFHINSNDKYLSVIADNAATRILHSDCKQHLTCKDCIESRDPHCAYDLQKKACIYVRDSIQSAEKMHTTFNFSHALQDILSASTDACPLDLTNASYASKKVENRHQLAAERKANDWFIGIAAICGLFAGTLVALFYSYGKRLCFKKPVSKPKGTGINSRLSVATNTTCGYTTVDPDENGGAARQTNQIEEKDLSESLSGTPGDALEDHSASFTPDWRICSMSEEEQSSSPLSFLQQLSGYSDRDRSVGFQNRPFTKSESKFITSRNALL